MKDTKQSHRLSGIDAAFIYLERKEIPLNIATVSIFEEPVPFEKFLQRILAVPNAIHRYRQIVVAPPMNIGYPTWVDDPHFDIRRHVFHVRLTPPGGEEELEALASHLISEVMDRRHPLWTIHVVEGLKDGRGAIIARVHHALADGVSGAALMKALFDTERDAPLPPRRPKHRPHPVKPPEFSLSEALASAVHSSLQNMISAQEVLLDFTQGLFTDRMQQALKDVGELLPELTASSERFIFNQPCGGERKFCWTEIPLDEAKAVKDAAGGTLNDVILTAVNRAFARYLKLHGEPVADRFIRIVCPVNVRQGDNGESLGNQISFMPVALPLGIEDPLEMLRAVARRTEIMKRARASHLVALLAAWIGSTPPPVQAAFWWGLPQLPLPLSVLNTIVTNVPGYPAPFYAVGKKMLASYPVVPTGYELGVNIAVYSYNGKLCFGFTADAFVVPDVHKLRDFVTQAFDELCKAAGVKRAKPAKAVARKKKASKTAPPAPQAKAKVKVAAAKAPAKPVARRALAPKAAVPPPPPPPTIAPAPAPEVAVEEELELVTA